MYADRILTITPVAFPVSYILILTGCILEGGEVGVCFFVGKGLSEMQKFAV